MNTLLVSCCVFKSAVAMVCSSGKSAANERPLRLPREVISKALDVPLIVLCVGHVRKLCSLLCLQRHANESLRIFLECLKVSVCFPLDLPGRVMISITIALPRTTSSIFPAHNNPSSDGAQGGQKWERFVARTLRNLIGKEFQFETFW